MIILGIETSCDETAAAVVQKQGNRIQILSNVVASSADLQAKYGGVIPEQAAREQIKSITPVIEEALLQASLIRHPELDKSCQETTGSIWIPDQVRNGKGGIPEIDAIAVTYSPGLIGSLLVGVETAKTLALVWKKPLIPINHLLGHFYANWITPSSVIPSPVLAGRGNLDLRKIATHSTSLRVNYPRNDNKKVPTFPCLGLLVSGGHTDLVLFEDHNKFEYLGGTRDDAAGECFDKCARLLKLSYPGGPAIAKLAQKGNPKAFDLPRPMINSKDFDFSFSGLKTAVANLLHTSPVSNNGSTSLTTGLRDPSLIVQDDRKGVQDDKTLADLAASIEAAIIEVLVDKTIKAAQMYKVDQIMIAGGVAANQKLVSELKLKIENLKLKTKLHVPQVELCTDNAAMIAAATFFNYQPINPLTLQVNPNLSLG